jgi:hypothetical protein
MRNYLDPVHLAITEEAWRGRVYAEIFASLNAILTAIEEVEESTDTRYNLVKFKLSQELYAQIYSNNPFKNEPKVQEFYTRQFERILADFCKRIEWCPGICILGSQQLPSFEVKNPLVPPAVLTEWHNLFKNCLSCHSNELLCLLGPISPPKTETEIESESALITDKLFRTHQVVQLFHIPGFVSAGLIHNPTLCEKSLRQAIEILYQQHVINDRWQPKRQPQEYVFDEDFWRDLKRGNIMSEDDEFKERFVSSMAQIVYDIEVDIRKHKYGTITIKNQQYPKYSADVLTLRTGPLAGRF